MSVANAVSGVVTLLSSRLKDRVKALKIIVPSEVRCMYETMSLCEGHCDTLLCALPLFANLLSVSICVAKKKKTQGVANCGVFALCALHAATHLPIVEVELDRAASLRDPSPVAAWRPLQRVKAVLCDVRSVAALTLCTRVRNLDVSSNNKLPSPAVLAGAPHLPALRATCCGSQDLEGLSICPALAYVDNWCNAKLRSLLGLCGAPVLQLLCAEACDVLDADGL